MELASRGRALLAAAACALLLAGCGSLRIGEENVVFPRAGAPVAAGITADGVWTIEPLQLTRGDVVLRGARFGKQGAKATVLYFGGNGFQLARHQQHLLETYAGLPVDVIVFDHRGYGGSSGAPTMDSLYDDGVALFDHVRSLEQTQGRPLALHGHSLGSFIAGHVASERKLDALVLESSATTAVDWIAGQAPWLGPVGKPLAWLALKPGLRAQGNADVMAGLDEPVLLVVGERDDVTRPSMSRALYRSAGVEAARKELLVVPDATHMNATSRPEYPAAFLRLLARAGAG